MSLTHYSLMLRDEARPDKKSLGYVKGKFHRWIAYRDNVIESVR